MLAIANQAIIIFFLPDLSIPTCQPIQLLCGETLPGVQYLLNVRTVKQLKKHMNMIWHHNITVKPVSSTGTTGILPVAIKVAVSFTTGGTPVVPVSFTTGGTPVVPVFSNGRDARCPSSPNGRDARCPSVVEVLHGILDDFAQDWIGKDARTMPSIKPLFDLLERRRFPFAACGLIPRLRVFSQPFLPKGSQLVEL